MRKKYENQRSEKRRPYAKRSRGKTWLQRLYALLEITRGKNCCQLTYRSKIQIMQKLIIRWPKNHQGSIVFFSGKR